MLRVTFESVLSHQVNSKNELNEFSDDFMSRCVFRALYLLLFLSVKQDDLRTSDHL